MVISAFSYLFITADVGRRCHYGVCVIAGFEQQQPQTGAPLPGFLSSSYRKPHTRTCLVQRAGDTVGRPERTSVHDIFRMLSLSDYEFLA